jgi:RNA polymerase sigma-70 factor (ECF subfamily)
MLPESSVRSDVHVPGSVETAVAEARARWPAIRCGVSELSEHVTELGERCGDLFRFGAELHLACACGKGDPAALRALDQEYLQRVDSNIRRVRRDSDFVDEVRQLLRHRLLMPPQPRISTYAATGPLLGWLRICAVRLALDSRRGADPIAEQILAERLAFHPTAEASEVPAYHLAFEGAVRSVFAKLEVRDRNLLRMHYLDALTLDELAALNDVHRATVARWLADLRRRIFAEVAGAVKGKLKLSPSEYRSLLAMIESQLHLSVSALFNVAEMHP